MSNTKNTAKKGNATTTKKPAKQELMTYPQAKALTNALFHGNYTKATLSAQIDQLPENVRGKGMNAEAKAKWLEEHGKEPATYGQCKMYAFGLLNAKTSHEVASQLIAQLDEKNGYVRQPKAEKTVKEANEKASKAKEEKTEEQASLFDSIESSDKDTPKA